MFSQRLLRIVLLSHWSRVSSRATIGIQESVYLALSGSSMEIAWGKGATVFVGKADELCLPQKPVVPNSNNGHSNKSQE